MKVIVLLVVALVAFASSEPFSPARGIPKNDVGPPPFVNRLRHPRSANPQSQGSVVLKGEKPLSGPDRRPTINLDYEQKWKGKRGEWGVSAGGQSRGGKVKPHVGIQGTWRFKRSAEPQGSIVLQGQQPLDGPDRRPTYNLDYQQNWQSKHGEWGVSAGGQSRGGRVEPHVGMQGTWRFRRSAEPQGSIVLKGQKPLDGPDRRPTYNLDYQQNWKNKHGEWGVSAGGQSRGGRVEPHVGVQGTWRFRRSAEPQGSIVLQGQKPLDGPDRRPTYNLDYQQNWKNKHGEWGVSAGGQSRGGRVEPHVGMQGTWRFRRSAEPQGSIVLKGQKPLDGPDRRPTYNLDYQQNWQSKHGEWGVSAGGQSRGGRVEPHVGMQGTWRFRRSAEPQGSIVLQGQQPLDGPDRRPTYNLDYQQNWQGKYGEWGVSAGGQSRGGRVEPHVGMQGTWRFRRSADPQGSIVLQGQQPLSGPDRRPTYNLDYQQKWKSRNGEWGVSAGGQSRGGRVEPHVGVQGTWRF